MSVFVILVSFLFLISPIIALYEGENCKVPETGQNGTCISVFVCDYVKKVLQLQQRPQNCGFNIRGPLICCPCHVNEEIMTSASVPGSRSVEKCNEYHDHEQFAIAQGFKAIPKEFPHMAALGYGDPNNILWLCGGTLISDKFILTAAHCTTSNEFGNVKWVRLGDLDLKNTTEEANPLDIPVDKVFVHPSHKPPSYYNDIALLQLKEAIWLGIFYKAACLYVNHQLPYNTLQATGWGTTDFLGDASSHLMKVDLNIIEYSRCSRAYASISARRLPNGIVDDTQICAGDSLGTGKDTCPGDSGGPLHYLVEKNEKLFKHFVVVGITSFGKGCGIGDTVGVYTRVSAYIDWIENIVWPVGS